MNKQPKDQRLPGMPGAPPEVRQRREATNNAIRDLHAAMRRFIDNLRGQDTAQIALADKIEGDRIRVTITPAKEANCPTTHPPS